MISQARGARTMVRVKALPRPAMVGALATLGHTSRILASPTDGGTTPVTACWRISTMRDPKDDYLNRDDQAMLILIKTVVFCQGRRYRRDVHAPLPQFSDAAV